MSVDLPLLTGTFPLKTFLSPISLLVHTSCLLSLSSSLTVYFSVLRQGALSTDTKNLLEDRSLEPGLVFFFSPHLFQKITTRCLCVRLSSWNTSQSLSQKPKKPWKKHTCETIHLLFAPTIVHLSWKESASWYMTELKHCTVCCCPPLTETHAHHVWLTLLKSHFPVIVHYSDLVINTTNKSKKTWECFLFCCFANESSQGKQQLVCRRHNKRVAEIKMKLRWLFLPLRTWYISTLIIRSPHLAISEQIWCQQESKTYVRWYRRRLMMTFHHMWTIWCTHGLYNVQTKQMFGEIHLKHRYVTLHIKLYIKAATNDYFLDEPIGL